MRRALTLAALLAGVVLLLLPAGATAAKPDTIRIESWLQRVNDGGNPLVKGDVLACAKVWIGSELPAAPTDAGGGPTWTSGTGGSYDSLAVDPSAKCTAWTAVGGYRFEGNGHLLNDGLDHVLFARHVIALAHGTIEIQFVGKYSPTFAGTGNWVITGGTGDYARLQGTGTWQAQGYGTSTGLYFMHTEVGSVHVTGH